jgi:hypothetical protein
MKTYVNVIVNEENKRKAVFILKAKGKTLTDMVNEQIEKLAKEFDQKNSNSSDDN